MNKILHRLRTDKCLHSWVFRVLNKLRGYKHKHGNVVPFKYANHIVATTFHVNRNECYEIYRDLGGLIRIHNYHGIEILHVPKPEPKVGK